MPEVGTTAPDFTLNDKDGTIEKVKPDTNAEEIPAHLRQGQ